MNQYYEKIMNLKEADEIKDVVKRWNTLSENIKVKATEIPIILPDMFWVAKSGVGKTTLLNLLSGYLSEQKNLMEFYGDVKFFEFLLSYSKPNEIFGELQRLINEIENAAGFRNEFKGIIHIDINEWLEHFEDKYFISFMEFISSNSDNWLIILSAYSEDAKKIENLYAFLSMFLRIEKVTLSLPKTEDLFDYIEKNLNSYGLSLEKEARDLLYETIEKIRKSKYFDGYKAIKMLCQDIVYTTFSKSETVHNVLTKTDLSDFSSESEYVKRMISNFEKTKQIGFGQ